jgi:sigma-B regulation protein RsbU (phosphoserine phosphatase)
MHSKDLPPYADDFNDFFESSLCCFVITDADGNILRMNRRTTEWLNCEPTKFLGKRFSDILTVGGRIYFETHLWPLLSMQGYFDEVALELADTGQGKLPIYINCYDRKDETGQSVFKTFTLFRASDRRLYEENLQIAKRLAETKLMQEQQQAVIREQFIAVLGHDLRNPLGGIMSAADLLARNELNARDAKLVGILQASSKRMFEMINNIMDLARGRLGGGITIIPITSDLQKLLHQVAAELQVSWPQRIINTDFEIDNPIQCDPARIAQLVSNLLANALTHGSSNETVLLKAKVSRTSWEISVINKGKPIPEEALQNLFQPFHREGHRSNNGLGLGLYIASEIAKAHNGLLTVASNEEQTCFTFRADY